MTTLLACGCSHTAGSEILEDGVDTPELSYSAVVADHYGFDYVNISKCGASNEFIASAAVNWILSQPDEVKNDLFVVIGWSTTPRFSFYYDSRLMHSTPGLVGNKQAIDNMLKHIDDGEDIHKLIEYYFGTISSETYINQWFSDIIYIDSFMKLHNIPYLMVNTGMHYESSHIKASYYGEAMKNIGNIFYPNQYKKSPCDPCLTPDTETIVNNIANYHNPTDPKSTFFDICKDYPKNKWQHFTAPGHKYFGEYLIPIIGKIIDKD